MEGGLAAGTGDVALGLVALALGDRRHGSGRLPIIGRGARGGRIYGVGIRGHLERGKGALRQHIRVVGLAKIPDFGIATQHRGERRVGGEMMHRARECRDDLVAKGCEDVRGKLQALAIIDVVVGRRAEVVIERIRIVIVGAGLRARRLWHRQRK